MKIKKPIYLILMTIVPLFVIMNCGGTPVNPNSTGNQELGSIIFKINSPGQLGKIAVFPVPGGDLSIQSALINISEIQLGMEDHSEENSDADSTDVQSGFDGEQEGEYADNDLDSLDGDVSILGPFAVDISSGLVEIATLSVPAGIYNEISLILNPSDAAEFGGSSIAITGLYNSDSLGTLDVNLNSTYDSELACALVDSTIAVDVASEVPVTVTFDLLTWFGSLDFTTAEVSENGIVINNNSNIQLLQAFNDHLENNIQVGEDSDEDNGGGDDEDNDDGGDENDDEGGDEDGGEDGEGQSETTIRVSY